MYSCIQRISLEAMKNHKEILRKYPNAFSDGVSIFAPTKMFTKDYENSFNNFALTYKEITAMGVSVHANFCTIGHSDTGVGGNPINCETMVDSKGKGCLCSACPRGDKFKKLLSETIEDYSKLHVPVLWVDDDFRLSFHSPVDYGCFCDNCMAKFNQKNGLNLTREELREALLKDGVINGKKVRLLWQNFSRESLEELAKVIADSAHAIDDSIIIGYMQINPEMVAYDITDYKRIIEVSKNKKGEVYFRHGSGYYSDYTPYEIVQKSISIGRLCSLTKSKDYKITNYTEEVTLPYIRRSKSMKNTILECVLGLAFSGADGVMDEAVFANPTEQFREGNVVSVMHDKNAYLSLIKDLIQNKKQIGAYPYFSVDLWSYNDEVKELKDLKDLGASIWDKFFLTGVPITFDKEGAKALLLSGKTVRAMSAEELKYWLSRGVYMDGTSAVETNKKIGGMTGVESFSVETIGLSNRGTGEQFTDHPLNGKYKNHKRFNLAQMVGLGNAKLKLDGAEVLSYSENDKERELGVLGSTIYDNSLGGRVAVSSRGTWDEDILSQAKVEQIKNVFDYLAGGKMPVRLESVCRVGMTVWEDEKERIVFLFNIDYDEEINAELILDGKYSASFLNEDLSFEDIGEGERIKVPMIKPWETGIIRLKKK